MDIKTARRNIRIFLAGLCLTGAVPTARAATTSTGSGTNITASVSSTYAQKKQTLIRLYKPFLAEFEGTRYNLYDDKGNPAIGYGYNFDTNQSGSYTFLEITPAVAGGEISLNKKDMDFFASGLSLETLRKKYPRYKFATVTKTAKDLKKLAKPKGNAKTFKGSIYVMPKTTVNQLNDIALNRYIDKTANIVGPYTFYKEWPIGWEMASTDMCYVDGNIEGTRFLQDLRNGNIDAACAEAWTSAAERNEPDSPFHYKQHKRRMESRGYMLREINIASIAEASESLRQYIKLLPGEAGLYHAMGHHLNYVAKSNMAQQEREKNATTTTTQNSSDGR
ncbi:MAG: hypothetical protein J6Y85_03965 [Alphaproteobacteria bacterium]|nr:hypothetical protein [Alphaproteobacteria bacterium]